MNTTHVVARARGGSIVPTERLDMGPLYELHLWKWKCSNRNDGVCHANNKTLQCMRTPLLNVKCTASVQHGVNAFVNTHQLTSRAVLPGEGHQDLQLYRYSRENCNTCTGTVDSSNTVTNRRVKMLSGVRSQLELFLTII